MAMENTLLTGESSLPGHTGKCIIFMLGWSHKTCTLESRANVVIDIISASSSSSSSPSEQGIAKHHEYIC